VSAVLAEGESTDYVESGERVRSPERHAKATSLKADSSPGRGEASGADRVGLQSDSASRFHRRDFVGVGGVNLSWHGAARKAVGSLATCFASGRCSSSYVQYVQYQVLT
jgi:hypothetical protein